MPAPFAALEARVTRAVFARLANAAGSYLDAHGQLQSVSGIFDAPGTQGALGAYGMASTQPSFSLPTVDVPADPVGLRLTLGACDYIVAAHEPDGAGQSRLMLEAA